MRVSVLGAVAVLGEDDGPLDLGTRKQRAIVAALVLADGQPLPVDRIVDLLWGDEPPPGVSTTLQSYISNLRRVLEPGRAPRAPAEVLLTVGSAYALRLPADATDVRRFEAAVASARGLLGALAGAPATAALRAADPAAVAAARTQLTGALELWRGTPYDELGDYADAESERARLEELRATALELLAVADLGSGDADSASARLETLTGRYPLRERLWALRALALTRSGRQADALAALRHVRTLLDDELGIDPGAELRDLETRILRQDPTLAAAEPPPAPAGGPAAATPGPGPAPPPRPAGGTVRADAWPMVGRDDALADLERLLDATGSGQPQFAAIVGEPGIGKSRLCRELARRAADRGALLLTGRCSQDEGAPPLWPWAAVLDPLPGAAALLAASNAPGVAPAEAEFATRDAACRALTDAAADRQVLVVLDDLHWSDSASLRLLAHLAQTAESGRLLVVGTWRPHPAPTGALAATADAFGRRHATRIELTGLGEADTSRLVAVVTGSTPTPREADALRLRTDGNPFYLVEYARLGESAPYASPAQTPPAVSDVITQRLETLPSPTLDVLRPAAVLGRQFELPALVALTGYDEDDLLDRLEPAEQAGLVLELGVDRFRFSHALVRDAAYASLPLSRRARWHARAATYADSAANVTEAARHWLEAGPAHSARAWRVAAEAAREARRVFAHEEASDLLQAAVRAHQGDPDGRWQDRYDMLMLLVDDRRGAADWIGLTDAMVDALRLAQEHGDVRRCALAAEAGYRGALWQPRTHADHLPVVLDALRSALRDLPPEDSELRCRVMLSLAVESYYISEPPERDALTEHALAMARRLGDDTLLLAALQAGSLAIWRSATTAERLAMLDEAVALARQLGDEAALANALTLQACCRGELGLVLESFEHAEEALRIGRRRRLRYVVLVMSGYLIPWLSMRGRHEQAALLLEEMTAQLDPTSLPQGVEAVAGASVCAGLWGGDLRAVMAQVTALAGSSMLQMGPALAVLQARTGNRDLALAMLRQLTPSDPPDDWSSQLLWPVLGEVALLLGDLALAARVYERVAPLAGRPAMAGTGGALGPVDAFLGFAAATTGETALASRHADDAERLCREWDLPLALEWVRRSRAELGY